MPCHGTHSLSSFCVNCISALKLTVGTGFTLGGTWFSEEVRYRRPFHEAWGRDWFYGAAFLLLCWLPHERYR